MRSTQPRQQQHKVYYSLYWLIQSTSFSFNHLTIKRKFQKKTNKWNFDLAISLLESIETLKFLSNPGQTTRTRSILIQPFTTKSVLPSSAQVPSQLSWVWNNGRFTHIEVIFFWNIWQDGWRPSPLKMTYVVGQEY